jgi:hypothetical protein
MTISELSITVFVTQLIFVGLRTWNVISIAEKNLMRTVVSGTLCHIAWLASIAIGSVSMYEVMNNGDLRYIPVVVASIFGGTIGSAIGLTIAKKYEKHKENK